MTKRINPLEAFTHVINGVTLLCRLECEAGERETRSEPGFESSAKLVHAYTEKGDDVAALLDEDQELEIECAFLEQEEEV